DWMAPHRIRTQVAALRREGADLCGLRRLLFHDLARGPPWIYEYPANRQPWLAGGTLLYTRAIWQRTPFSAVGVGEDTRFVWGPHGGRVFALPDLCCYVALIHAANTSPKHTRGTYWVRWSGDLREIM